MGLTVAIILLVALLVLLIVLAVSVSRLRRRQVASYTPEERRRQGVRGAWVRLGEDIRELDDAAHDHDAPAAVREAFATAEARHREARELLDGPGDDDEAKRVVADGQRSIDEARRVLYESAGRTPPPAGS